MLDVMVDVMVHLVCTISIINIVIAACVRHWEWARDGWLKHA